MVEQDGMLLKYIITIDLSTIASGNIAILFTWHCPQNGQKNCLYPLYLCFLEGLVQLMMK